MAIALVTGAPGAGKTYYAVRRIKAALESGQMVATNIELAAGWAEDIARSNLLTRLVPGRVRKRAAEYRRRVLVSADLSQLFAVRIAGCRKCDGCKRHGTCRREGRGVMVLDEAHNWINGRTWDVDESGSSARDAKGAAVRRRLEVVRFFSQHRKLGWNVDLITQSAESLDAQVRRLMETHVRLRNIGRFKVAGIRIFPVNLFIAIHIWNDPSKSILKRDVYRLVRRTARLYDTMALSHGLDDDDADDQARIVLPRPRSEAPPSGTLPPSPRAGTGIPLNAPVHAASSIQDHALSVIGPQAPSTSPSSPTSHLAAASAPGDHAEPLSGSVRAS